MAPPNNDNDNEQFCFVSGSNDYIEEPFNEWKIQVDCFMIDKLAQ